MIVCWFPPIIRYMILTLSLNMRQLVVDTRNATVNVTEGRDKIVKA